MQIRNTITGKWFMIAAAAVAFAGCQKMERPAMGEYTKDANPPGGPLKFYAAFDGTTTDPLMNAVDSSKATFPASNPLASVEGVSGKAIQGENKKFIKYPKPNDWAVQAKSFTISFWYKKNGQTQNNTGGNGPEYIFSFPSSNKHWTGGNMALFLEGNNAAAAVKLFVVDKDGKDPWFTWEKTPDFDHTIPGLLDNQWHHMALVYTASNSTMILYVDGVVNPNKKTPKPEQQLQELDLDNSQITEFRIGAGPGTKYDSDDWLSSSFKGQIDQFRMYSEPLSAADVNGLFTGKK